MARHASAPQPGDPPRPRGAASGAEPGGTPGGPVRYAAPVLRDGPEKDANRTGLEDRERDWFQSHYAESAPNPVGLRERMRRELRSLLRTSGEGRLGRVLSVGCGNGVFEILLAPHAEHVVGLDISQVAVEQARVEARARGIENVEFRCQALSELLWGETFDGIVCLAFLHHLHEEDVDPFLATIHAHLRPGGFFYSQDPNQRGILRKVGRRLLGDRYDQHHSEDERELDPGDIERRLVRAGFESVDIGYIDMTLIPLQYVFSKGPDWLMRPLVWIDRAWCASPFARWASGFRAFALRRAGAGPVPEPHTGVAGS